MVGLDTETALQFLMERLVTTESKLDWLIQRAQVPAIVVSKAEELTPDEVDQLRKKIAEETKTFRPTIVEDERAITFLIEPPPALTQEVIDEQVKRLRAYTLSALQKERSAMGLRS